MLWLVARLAQADGVALDGDRIAACGDGGLQVVDRRTGELLWRAPDCGNALALIGGQVFVRDGYTIRVWEEGHLIGGYRLPYAGGWFGVAGAANGWVRLPGPPELPVADRLTEPLALAASRTDACAADLEVECVQLAAGPAGTVVSHLRNHYRVGVTYTDQSGLVLAEARVGATAAAVDELGAVWLFGGTLTVIDRTGGRRDLGPYGGVPLELTLDPVPSGRVVAMVRQGLTEVRDAETGAVLYRVPLGDSGVRVVDDAVWLAGLRLDRSGYGLARWRYRFLSEFPELTPTPIRAVLVDEPRQRWVLDRPGRLAGLARDRFVLDGEAAIEGWAAGAQAPTWSVPKVDLDGFEQSVGAVGGDLVPIYARRRGGREPGIPFESYYYDLRWLLLDVVSGAELAAGDGALLGAAGPREAWVVAVQDGGAVVQVRSLSAVWWETQIPALQWAGYDAAVGVLALVRSPFPRDHAQPTEVLGVGPSGQLWSRPCERECRRFVTAGGLVLVGDEAGWTALDLKTGAERWKVLGDPDAVIVELR